jgi:uncharacterized protein YodC (DUF2158 family)
MLQAQCGPDSIAKTTMLASINRALNIWPGRKKGNKHERLYILEIIMKVGDIVTLKSGGSNMTIVSINPNCISCHWSEKGIMHKNDYTEDALVVIIPTDSINKRDYAAAQRVWDEWRSSVESNGCSFVRYFQQRL